jgi:hypothetical protein
MIITLFDGQRSETYNWLSEAADAAKNWYSDLEEDAPPWDYEIQTYDDLLEAVEEHKKRICFCCGEPRRLLPKASADGYRYRRRSRRGSLSYG